MAASRRRPHQTAQNQTPYRRVGWSPYQKSGAWWAIKERERERGGGRRKMVYIYNLQILLVTPKMMILYFTIERFIANILSILGSDDIFWTQIFLILTPPCTIIQVSQLLVMSLKKPPSRFDHSWSLPAATSLFRSTMRPPSTSFVRLEWGCSLVRLRTGSYFTFKRPSQESGLFACQRTAFKSSLES